MDTWPGVTSIFTNFVGRLYKFKATRLELIVNRSNACLGVYKMGSTTKQIKILFLSSRRKYVTLWLNKYPFTSQVF